MPTKTGEGTTNQITNKKCLCFLAAFDSEGRWRAKPSNELQAEKSRVAGCDSVASGCLLSAESWQDETPAQIAADGRGERRFPNQDLLRRACGPYLNTLNDGCR